MKVPIIKGEIISLTKGVAGKELNDGTTQNKATYCYWNIVVRVANVDSGGKGQQQSEVQRMDKH